MLPISGTPVGPVVLMDSLAILPEVVPTASVVDLGSVGLPLLAQKRPVLSTALEMLRIG
jgi:hypothetical protein